MASPPFLSVSLLIVLFLSLSSQLSQSMLTVDYYAKSCPQFPQIVAQVLADKQISHPTTGAGVLRLFLHDCFVSGCDASVLISSTPFRRAERDADINLSLPGDAFDAVARAKAALELSCPGVVSCADILSLAARDLLRLLGGPFYDVRLGRKDGRASDAAAVAGRLPGSHMDAPRILSIFRSKGFSAQEMVALSGAHTVGFSHCSEFSDVIFFDNSSSSGYSRRGRSSYDPRFLSALREACRDHGRNPTLSVFNDIMTPSKFDNMYFKNLQMGLGVLPSDHALYEDPATRGYVDLYARDQDRFFKDFARAMEKLSRLEVKVGGMGEVRRRCDAFNN